eukprot:5303334-Alexandrium_andersonii.AAC.1
MRTSELGPRAARFPGRTSRLNSRVWPGCVVQCLPLRRSISHLRSLRLLSLCCFALSNTSVAPRRGHIR